MRPRFGESPEPTVYSPDGKSYEKAVYTSHFGVKLAFCLARLRLVNSRRQSHAFLELLVSTTFSAYGNPFRVQKGAHTVERKLKERTKRRKTASKLTLGFAILRCSSVPIQSRTSMYAPLWVLATPCLARIYDFFGLRKPVFGFAILRYKKALTQSNANLKNVRKDVRLASGGSPQERTKRRRTCQRKPSAKT